jgi:drug/metabolite transporter (DMT)-like permease
MIVPINAILALLSAASWGGGDFSGGMGVKAASQSPAGSTVGALRVVVVAHATSLTVLAILLALTGFAIPHGAYLAWGLAAGVAAGFSLTAFYIALSRGAMGASAAISGLLAAAIPGVVSTLLEGAPGPLRIAGFVLAMAAIWTIAAGPSPENTGESRATIALAIFGGMGFGFYFVALKMDNAQGVMEPMAMARAASLITCLSLLGLVGWKNSRVPPKSDTAETPSRSWLSKTALAWAMGVALLDTGGNLLFLAATRVGRLDVAAVLASLYPAGTILLAAWHLHERPTRRQGWGMALALLAVIMITI